MAAARMNTAHYEELSAFKPQCVEHLWTTAAQLGLASRNPALGRHDAPVRNQDVTMSGARPWGLYSSERCGAEREYHAEPQRSLDGAEAPQGLPQQALPVAEAMPEEGHHSHEEGADWGGRYRTATETAGAW